MKKTIPSCSAYCPIVPDVGRVAWVIVWSAVWGLLGGCAPHRQTPTQHPAGDFVADDSGASTNRQSLPQLSVDMGDGHLHQIWTETATLIEAPSKESVRQLQRLVDLLREARAIRRRAYTQPSDQGLAAHALVGALAQATVSAAFEAQTKAGLSSEKKPSPKPHAAQNTDALLELAREAFTQCADRITTPPHVDHVRIYCRTQLRDMGSLISKRNISQHRAPQRRQAPTSPD